MASATASGSIPASNVADSGIRLPATGSVVQTSQPGTSGSGLPAATAAPGHLSSGTTAAVAGNASVYSEIANLRDKVDRLEALLTDKGSETTFGASTPEDKEAIARLV